jgi:hypothetical protein
MNLLLTPNPNERPRLPGETLGRGVWLYVRVCLSNRDGAELMAERRVTLTNEVVRYWCRTCGQADAHQLRCRPPPGTDLPEEEVRKMLTDVRSHYQGASARSPARPWACAMPGVRGRISGGKLLTFRPRLQPASEIAGAAGGHEPEPAVAAARRAVQGPPALGRYLWLVYRKV